MKKKCEGGWVKLWLVIRVWYFSVRDSNTKHRFSDVIDHTNSLSSQRDNLFSVSKQFIIVQTTDFHSGLGESHHV